MRCLLVLNAGSSSLKASVFGLALLDRICAIEVTGIGEAAKLGDEALADVVDQEGALAAIVARLSRTFEWIAVGHRFAHGRDFVGPRVIDAAVRAVLESLIPLAPLHQAQELAVLAAAERLAPGALQIACFDTAFHHTIPDVARWYALPRELSEGGLVAYGFHGLSYEYIASVLPDHLGARADGRVIVAHLGSGASMCAMRGRRSLATTMGFTPLDGLPMATRVGAIDPGVVLHLVERMGLDATRDLLYHRSGLLGVSGSTGNMQALLASTDPRAAEAIELFVYRAARQIASLAGALGGLDALVFTGGIGEHSPDIRRKIMAEVAWLGAATVCVVPTDEARAIAHQAATLLMERGVQDSRA